MGINKIQGTPWHIQQIYRKAKEPVPHQKRELSNEDIAYLKMGKGRPSGIDDPTWNAMLEKPYKGLCDCIESQSLIGEYFDSYAEFFYQCGVHTQNDRNEFISGIMQRLVYVTEGHQYVKSFFQFAKFIEKVLWVVPYTPPSEAGKKQNTTGIEKKEPKKNLNKQNKNSIQYNSTLRNHPGKKESIDILRRLLDESEKILESLSSNEEQHHEAEEIIDKNVQQMIVNISAANERIKRKFRF